MFTYFSSAITRMTGLAMIRRVEPLLCAGNRSFSSIGPQIPTPSAVSVLPRLRVRSLFLSASHAASHRYSFAVIHRLLFPERYPCVGLERLSGKPVLVSQQYDVLSRQRISMPLFPFVDVSWRLRGHVVNVCTDVYKGLSLKHLTDVVTAQLGCCSSRRHCVILACSVTLFTSYH